MIWYVVWLIGLWLVWQVTNAAGLTYNSSSASLMIKLILVVVWTVALGVFSHFVEKSKGK